MIEQILREIVQEKKLQGNSKSLIRNYLKEYIQYLVLSLLYNQNKMKNLVFKGGSCLRICYELPRLSEDLDFDYDENILGKKILEELDLYLKKEIRNKYYFQLETKIQSTIRLYLKFPFLKDLGLATASESNKLYVKVETSNELSPFAGYTLTPISKFGFNFVAYHYDMPTLMSGKINALLFRVWIKTSKKQEDEVDIKGRDFYDLFWFLQKGIEPNYKMLSKTAGIKNKKELKNILIQRIEKVVTPQKLSYDLNNFISDNQFVEEFSKNYLTIMNQYF
ncbi:MAG: nucleotidyl transferase AbiEii/AbiGii toxin family protein [Candidatus Roizmanbacteria bacterium]|nr:nucleotidyl transferase AbiEii/AbiGii toxin family protein [Candidatus Roizmanbacteria bacterium]